MINANRARVEAILNNKGKKYIERIEKAILKAVENGNMYCDAPMDLQENHPDSNRIVESIVGKLEDLGYDVVVAYAKSKPTLCPSDQWDDNNGYFRVGWEMNDDNI